MRFVPDAWLAMVLDRPVFSVHDCDGGPETPGAVRAHASAHPGAFYFARLAATAIDRVAALTRAGFNVVEASVTFDREVGDAADAAPACGIDIALADERWRAAVLDIAGSTFQYSRFHLDPAFGRATADRVKREWIRSYFDRRRGDRLLVALDHGEPVGFLALLMTERGSRPVAVIDLVGVRPSMYGHGVGRALVAGAVEASRGRSDLLEVGTQSANVPSMRLYEKTGFRAARTGFVLHLHTDRS